MCVRYVTRVSRSVKKEYRTPIIVIVSLARVRLEPPPHLAFGLAGTSLPDRFYTFVSPTLVDVRARLCSLARSFARTAARRFYTRAVPPRPRGSIFFFFFCFLPRRTYAVERQGPCVAHLVDARGHFSPWVGALGARTNGRSREGSTTWERALTSPIDECVHAVDRIAIEPISLSRGDTGNVASASTKALSPNDRVTTV